jgi:hypothetical protein
MSPHERAGPVGPGLEVSESVDGAVVLGVPGVPVHPHPRARVALDGSHVFHCPGSAWIAGRVDSLAHSELGIRLSGLLLHLLLLLLCKINDTFM